jgi:hypothetical protein
MQLFWEAQARCVQSVACIKIRTLRHPLNCCALLAHDTCALLTNCLLVSTMQNCILTSAISRDRGMRVPWQSFGDRSSGNMLDSILTLVKQFPLVSALMNIDPRPALLGRPIEALLAWPIAHTSCSVRRFYLFVARTRPRAGSHARCHVLLVLAVVLQRANRDSECGRGLSFQSSSCVTQTPLRYASACIVCTRVRSAWRHRLPFKTSQCR